MSNCCVFYNFMLKYSKRRSGHMGLFGRRSKDIDLPDKFKNSVIYPVSNKLYTVRLGQNITVNKGWSVVFVVKEKPRDVMFEGVHELSLPNLPGSTRALKLDKGRVKRKSNKVELELPKTFKCDIYYVNNKPIADFLWRSGKVPVKSKLYGRYKVNLYGTLDFKIDNSSKFVSLMLVENSHIRMGKGEKILSDFFNEEIADSVLFSNFFNPGQFADKANINDFLLNKLNENFEQYGLHVEKVNTQNVEFFGKINEQIKRQDESQLQSLETQFDGVPDTQTVQQTVILQQPTPEERAQAEEELQALEAQPERVVVGAVKQKQKQSISDVQTEINESLFGTSRIDVTEVDKIKLDKKDNNQKE